KAYRDCAGAEQSPKKHKFHATSTENDGTPEPQQDLKVLVADSHPGVNIFLSWLNGILQGIRKGTLTTAQFSVFPDPTNQAKVIESYRFSFQYNSSIDHPATRLTGLTISAATQTSVSVKSIRSGLIELLGLVSSYTEKMPDLPDPSCDFREYGFEPGNNKLMIMPSQSDWRTRTINAGLVDAGHHRVSLNIDHVHLVDEATPQPDDVYGIPDKLHHNRTMSRITGSPQAATSNSSSPQEKYPRTNDSQRREGPTNDKQLQRSSPSTSVALEKQPVATQPAPIVFSPEQPARNVRLAQKWAARLERRASKRPVREEGRENPKDRKTGTTLLERLKDDGFFQVARSGRLKLAESPSQAARRQQVYCNPMTLIGHCYESREPEQVMT
ncbi:MAG: hypothetical protein Q9184_007094, partial [Pyrenodesmia sp. 2 TL-2023]